MAETDGLSEGVAVSKTGLSPSFMSQQYNPTLWSSVLGVDGFLCLDSSLDVLDFLGRQQVR